MVSDRAALASMAAAGVKHARRLDVLRPGRGADFLGQAPAAAGALDQPGGFLFGELEPVAGGGGADFFGCQLAIMAYHRRNILTQGMAMKLRPFTLVLALALAACGGSAAPASSTAPAGSAAAKPASAAASPSAKPAASAGASAKPAAAASSGPIKIGVVEPLTGSLSPNGKDGRDGFSLFLDSINSTVAGRKLEVSEADSQGAADVSLSKSKQLVESTGVKVLVGFVATPECYAVAGYVQQAKVPMMVTTDCAAQ